ncbi:splicing factor 3B subunit 2-like [Artemia franciscana]|uniref:PSP proline-rich domain-containing protein n=1 Tax=Artemia franciscana TaxID=6661 RepID=A0AA88L4P2_ARTSF|nr:hypothetical protein QYM36_015490 [Artemia franciscana]
MSSTVQQNQEKGLVPSLMQKLVPPPPGIEEKTENGPRLPSILEDVLKLKEERAKQLGIKVDELDTIDLEDVPKVTPRGKLQPRSLVPLDDQITETREKKEKLQRRKRKKKKGRRVRNEERVTVVKDTEKDEDEGIEIEYVTENLDTELADPAYRQFLRVFESFKMEEKPVQEVVKTEEITQNGEKEIDPRTLTKVPKIGVEEDEDEDEEEERDKDADEKPKLSKRKLKKLTRMTVAELKQAAMRPDVVEMHDVTAKDPKLLVLLKAYRNTVPVPRHWCFKRKYLQGKRGIEKPPFKLPEFIEKTGIMEMRAAHQEKEEQKTLKTKMREKVRPKLGKIDIDYEKLHDAFFKWQTKPKLTIHGDLYYEGKEFETKLKEKKPGDLSEELRTALGMPIGPNSNKFPPPWLIAMQRYGPPPSYPNLKIPGLNASIPDGCSFGYHAGGWGKPPVDEMGRPLYGDVFGTIEAEPTQPEKEPEQPEELQYWGELESEEEEEESEEEEEEEDRDESGLITPAEGLETPSGVTSVPLGLETPEMIELRKKRIEQEIEGGETPALYTILPERRTDRVGQAMMGSTHTYDVSAAAQKTGAVEVALEPSELEDMEAVAARYEAAVREQAKEVEDLSDLTAEHAARQRSKRKRQAQQKEDKEKKDSKKYKEFKF